MGIYAWRGGALVFLAACAMLFVSCGGGGGGHGGGGGGGGGGGADLMSAPGEAAITNWIQVTQNYNVNAKDAMGNTYNLVASSVPNAGTTTFNGQANAYSRVVTVSITKNGSAYYSTTYTDYYLLNPNWVPLGTVWSPSGTPYLLVNSGSFQPLPTTISVGDAGTIFDATYYHDSSLTTQDATLTVTYSITAHNASNLFLCLSYAIPSASVTAQGNTDGIIPGSQTYCFIEDGNGIYGIYSWTVYDATSGLTLTFQ